MYLFLVNLCFSYHLIRNITQMYIKQYFFFIKGKFSPSEVNAKRLKTLMLNLENLVEK